MLISQATFASDPEVVDGDFSAIWKVVYYSEMGLKAQQEIYLNPSQIARHVALYSNKSTGIDIYEVDIVLYGTYRVVRVKS